MPAKQQQPQITFSNTDSQRSEIPLSYELIKFVEAELVAVTATAFFVRFYWSNGVEETFLIDDEN